MVAAERGAEADDLRTSDAEREAAVATLRQHYSDGRLTTEEFYERVDEAYGARTRGQLARALRQLPAVATAGGEPPAPVRRRRTLALGRAAAQLAAPNVLAVGVWLLDGHHGVFWPAWVMVATAAVGLRRFGRGRWGPQDPDDRHGRSSFGTTHGRHGGARAHSHPAHPAHGASSRPPRLPG